MAQSTSVIGTDRWSVGRGAAAAVLLGCAAVGVARAGGTIDLPVVNPSFEDISGEDPFNEFTFGPLNGWDLHDPGGITDGGDGPVYFIGTLTPFEPDPKGEPGVFAFFPDGAPDGERVGIAFNFSGSGGGGEYGLVQTLDALLEPGFEFVLEVEIGNIASGVALSGDFFPLDGFPGYRVDLLAGDAVLASDENELGGSIPEGEFATSTVTFTARAGDPRLGEPLGIRLVNLNHVDPAFPESDLEVDFDDVRLRAEPRVATCPGDLVPDGVVDTTDLLELLACWSGGDPVDPPCSAADLDGDGAVGVADLLIVLGAWGDCG